MTAFLFLVVVLLAIWIARGASKTRRNERLIAELTSRIYNLEQEIQTLRARRPEPAAPAPIPVRRPVEAPPAIPVPERVWEPEPEPEPARQVIEAPVLEQAVPAQRFSFGKLLNFEETFGTNWLNKLGIVILVIGMALFLGYEMRTLGPAGKVLTGYLVAGAMLGAGVFFERREQWRILARAGIAGGWALAYFTTYAMNHVPAAQVLTSESADLVLLLAVAAAMVAHTLRYASQTVSGLAFLLAFTTINLSRGNAASLLASAILAAALAAVAVRRSWFEMELAGMAAAYVNHYLWLRPLIEPMHGHVHAFPEYAASATLLYAYWLIFRASYILRKVDDRRGEIISTIAAVLNVALFGWVMGYQSVHPELAFQFFLLIGVVEFLLGQLPVTRRRRAAFIVLTTLGACLMVMAFPFRYSGDVLSSSWLAISECLLVAGVLLREIVFRRLGLAVALVAWIQMMLMDATQAFAKSQPGLALLFGVAALLFYADSQYLPRRWPEVIERQADRWCFRQLSHLACGLALIGAWLAWPGAWTAVAWAALGLALMYAARRWRARELAGEAVVCAGLAMLRVGYVNQYADAAIFHTPWLSERLLTMALVIALFYFSSRWVSGFSDVSTRRISAGYTWAASILTGFLCWYELEPIAVALGWSMAALIVFEIGLRRHWRELRFQAYAGFAASFLRILVVNLNAIDSGVISARVYSVAPLVLAFYYVYRRLSGAADDSFATDRRFKIAQMHCLFGTLAAAALLRFELDADLVVVGWAALVWMLVFLAWKTDRRIFLDHAMLIGCAAFARGILHNLYERSYFPAPFGHGRIATVGTTILLLFAVLPFARRLRMKAAEKRSNWLLNVWSAFERRPDQVFFFLPFVLLTVLLAIEMPSGLVTLVWGVEAFAVFALAIWLKERSYRLSALGLVLLCMAKIVVRDVWGLAPRDRYLTFIVLGSALLAISYLYTRYRDVLRQYL